MSKMLSPAAMEAKIATLIAENRRLKKVAQHSGDALRLSRVAQDALMLLVWRFSGISIRREVAASMGMTSRRWQWARALLMLARVHNGWDVTAVDFVTAKAGLDAAVKSLEANGLGALRLRMPASAKVKNGSA